MLQQIRRHILDMLWQYYCQSTPSMQRILSHLAETESQPIVLDHVALIDLPGPATGIHSLRELFSLIGFREQGTGYLPDKQNDFLWMVEEAAHTKPVKSVLPQIVVADFRLEDMPKPIRTIIQKYASHATPIPFGAVKHAIKQAALGDKQALMTHFNCYLLERRWPLPSRFEWEVVNEYNQLLAWVLIYGCRPNHFAISIHHLTSFSDLNHFHQFIEAKHNIALSEEGGKIKGGSAHGIAQSSTAGIPQHVALEDGDIMLTTGFAEFVWRYPHQTLANPLQWGDYFTGFVATQANHVIESLYVQDAN
ncbi:MAG: hypothetical protein A3F43_00515 [Gammaproteobacteria bacterium RIFCSPHIGHO2_12_FULL_42_10]|nr:MAG: hypothetical protein A3F43_00515 [Gammaproteobacteria bacterium RIFCSPHIGHO2_12_FULL_42_10]